MTLQVQPHVKNIDRIRMFLGANKKIIWITLDDFVDLQTSPAYFIEPDDYRYTVLRPWVGMVENPVYHLSHTDRCYISKRLTG